MKTTVSFTKGARIPKSADTVCPCVLIADAQIPTGGVWDAAGKCYTGDLVISTPTVICGLRLCGTLHIAESAVGTTLEDCRIEGKTAIENRADGLTVLRSVLLYDDVGLEDRAASGTLLRDCHIEGKGTAVSSAAEHAQIMYCTLRGSVGIAFGGGENMIAARNEICGMLSADGAKNTVFLQNVADTLSAIGCHAVYLIENHVRGTLSAGNNNYIIADRNVYGALCAAENRNANGDTLTDVNHRPEYGADEALLPHIDKDLFVGMPRMEAVRDSDAAQALPLSAYINRCALTEDAVIVPPGAYCADEEMHFSAEASDTVVYAYGVYAERQQGIGRHLLFHGARNVQIRGMTIGFREQSCGQVYVLEKCGDDTLRVVTGAGMVNTLWHDGIGAHRAGTFYAYCDTGYQSIDMDEDICGVPTLRMKVDASLYRITNPGDIFTSRRPGGTTTVVLGAGCENIVFYDFTLYGNAGGFAFVEEETLTSATYYRVYDTTKNGPLIPEELYRAYRALEDKYSVSLEISEDAQGRFRGSLPHIGSIDATHTTNCAEGSHAYFCIFENMCDDATNQNHMASRLHEITDNGDGTTTLVYKGVLTQFNVRCKRYAPNAMCSDFKVGDRVYIYTADGQLLCDTKALSATVVLPDAETNDYGECHKVPMRSITIATGTFHTKPLEKFDLHLHTVDDDQKVIVDNMSMASNGFHFENCLFQNIRSRGLLIKASDGVIRNCIFRNIGMSCAAILYEIFWGESGVTENLVVENNLIDHTGYFRNVDLYAPISITGLGSSVDEDYLLYRNIVFRHNRIVNRTTDYAVYVNSAKDIKILDNDFGAFVGNDFTHAPEEPETDASPKPVIHINAAMNIEIAGNRYPATSDIRDQVVTELNRNVFGADVTVDGKPLFPDCP